MSFLGRASFSALGRLNSCLKLHEVSIVEKEIVMSISCLDNDLHCHLLGVSAICMVIAILVQECLVICHLFAEI